MSEPEQIGDWPSAVAGQWPVTYDDWAEAERDLAEYEREHLARMEKRKKREPKQPRQPKPPSEPKPPRRLRLPGETSRQYLKRRVIMQYLAGETVIKPEYCEAYKKQIQSIISIYLRNQSCDAVVDDNTPRPPAPDNLN